MPYLVALLLLLLFGGNAISGGGDNQSAGNKAKKDNQSAEIVVSNKGNKGNPLGPAGTPAGATPAGGNGTHSNNQGCQGKHLGNTCTKTVPEPLTIIGAATALGFGGLMQRKYSKNKQQNTPN